MSKAEVGKAIAQFCIMAGVQETKERIDLVAAYLTRDYSVKQITDALGRLIKKTKWFPDIPTMVEEIETQGLNPREIGILSVQDVLQAIEDNAFDPIRIKAAVGEESYRALGGATGIADYGKGDISRANMQAQLRDALAARQSFKRNTGKSYTEHKKIEGKKAELQLLKFEA